MRRVAVIGVGMTAFGKFPDRSLKDLAREALLAALGDAGVRPKAVGEAYCGNSLAGLLTGQESIRGQVLLREAGLAGLPVVNVENACASGSTAFRGAWLAVGSGQADVAVALGVEKMFVGDTARVLQALTTATDLEVEGAMGVFFPSLYAMRLRRHMEEFGVTKAQLALAAVKSHRNGALNPLAQFREPVTVDGVLASAVIVEPLHLKMCSAIGDGAAAAVLCAAAHARRFTGPPIRVAASVLRSGAITDLSGRSSAPDGAGRAIERAARAAYEAAGLGPGDVEVAEVHDAFAPGEILLSEDLGFCRRGEGVRLLEDGATAIGGRIPLNPSGGLTARGHPVGATGLAQIAEIVWQLREEAGARQTGKPQVGLVQNAGGNVGGDSAAQAIHILVR